MLTLNAAKFSITFSRIKRHPKALLSTEVEKAVSERCEAFAAAHRSDEDRRDGLVVRALASQSVDMRFIP